MKDFVREYNFCKDYFEVDYKKAPLNFQGIVRKNGSVATRNYISVVSSVNCSAHVCRQIAKYFDEEVLSDYPNVDGVVPIHHRTGCGMGATGEPIEYIQRVLSGYITHPNFGYSLLIGLGCEANQIKELVSSQGLNNYDNLNSFTIQDTGGTSKTIERGISIIKEILAEQNNTKRENVSISNLTLGLQCGGSDGYSGLTANPSLGHAVDLLVQNGGTAVLSETPEIYGAEHLLTKRAVTEEVGQKLVDRIKWWENYTTVLGGKMDNNPSPGNKAGGLTTILEKSLGAVAKGGTQPLMDVYKYAEKITKKGFVFMDSPGYDPVSVTGQVASGANIVCFTTGRGSAYGCKPAPSIKLATNNFLFQKQYEDMDINCGEIISGESSIEDKGQEILKKIISTASGKKSKSEVHQYGEDEFAPWVLGPTM
jgi:altronate hydrolase